MSHYRSRSRSRSRSPSYDNKSGEGNHDDKRDTDSWKKLSKEEKERLKDLETPEEKRQRRLAKKQAKDQKRQEKGESSTGRAEGYSAVDNPFGDQNLNDKFVWHKKYESLETSGVSRNEVVKRENSLRSENQVELDRVRKAREQRELEKQMMLDEKDRVAREKEDAHFSKWIQQEDAFHLNQARQRSEIRLKEGRAKPIDRAAQYINLRPDEMSVTMHEPFAVFSGLPLADLEDLMEDIKVYAKLERETNPEYWLDMATISEHTLVERRREAAQRDPTVSAAEKRALESGISPQVRSSIMDLLRGKSHAELLTLQAEIRRRISSGSALDVTYWEALLEEMKSQLSMARLRERHKALIDKARESLRFQQGGPAPDQAPAAKGAGPAAAAPRSFSPVPSREVPAGMQLLDPAEDARRLHLARQDVIQRLATGRLAAMGPMEKQAGAAAAIAKIAGSAVPAAVGSMDGGVDASQLADVMYKAEEDRGVGVDEEEFNDDVALPTTVKYSWAGKHHPRKPRFFNRVMTGFEWNQYNRTHYDIDNPPPKMVHGYKFTVFYPDLIDKTVSPTFSVSPVATEPGFVILRFTAGPPYEDLAFKILDLPWLYSRRAGFRCQFDRNNIFQLWFCFRRERYRR
jgi:hypothetical protein